MESEATEYELMPQNHQRHSMDVQSCVYTMVAYTSFLPKRVHYDPSHGLIPTEGAYYI
jgi:hypothetical protein